MEALAPGTDSDAAEPGFPMNRLPNTCTVVDTTGGSILMKYLRHSQRHAITVLLCLLGTVLPATAPTLTAQEPVRLSHPVDGSDSYRLVAINDQQISLNGVYVRDAQIVTRVQIDRSPGDDSRAVYDALFYLTESTRLAPDPVGVVDRYPSRFVRDSSGIMEIDSRYVMPVVRDFPTFPDRPLVPGDTWSGRAWELHDLSEGYDLPEPVTFEVPVSYRYVGVEEVDRRILHRIDAEYNIFHQETHRTALYPQQIVGRSEQTLWWDQEKGRLARIEEEYLIRFFLNDGQTITYEGRSVTTGEAARPLDRSVIGELRRQIERDGIDDTEIEPDEEGIAITLENIRFPPDSARILPEERRRIEYIAGILRQFPENDILITGHTALAGTAQGRQALSIERARAVGELLIDQGARDAAEVYYRGLGAREPIADNATEAGRRRNRRVEITILDN